MNDRLLSLLTDRAPRALLIAAPMLYHPGCGNGGGVLCFELLRRLAPHAAIHFVGYAHGDDDAVALAALAPLCESVTPVPLPRSGSRWAGWIGQLAAGRPREVQRYDDATMAVALREVRRRSGAEVALLQFPHMAQFVDALAPCPVIVDVQDACIVSRHREWQQARGTLLRLSKASAWHAWLRHETRHYARAQQLMALSDTDLGVLRAFVPGVPAFVSPVACDPTRALPRVSGARRVVFVGNFGHPPNLDALRWLLDEVWPRVRIVRPDAHLAIAGPRCPPLAADAARGVEVLGFVDDLPALFAGAAASLVPYRFGGGVKIKALESMALGAPLVATRIGVEGLHVEPGVQALVADDAAAFADAIVALVDSPALQQRLAIAARMHVTRQFGWDRKVAELLERLDALAGTPRRPAVEAAA